MVVFLWLVFEDICWGFCFSWDYLMLVGLVFVVCVRFGGWGLYVLWEEIFIEILVNHGKWVLKSCF